MKNHPIADVWPMMDEAKLTELADDIRKNGQLVPVWLYEGKILDGRNRWAACKIAGVEPKTREYTGDEPTAFAVSLNDRRRHMNKGSLAAVAAELEPHFAASLCEAAGVAIGHPSKDLFKISAHRAIENFLAGQTRQQLDKLATAKDIPMMSLPR
jgi:hypothetical protein